MNHEEFEKFVNDIKGFSNTEKNLLMLAYKIGFVAGSRAMQESIWGEELATYNKQQRKYDA